tara:strand:- start:716 stop:1111 length:396 start_codon:yes stop_codon:yes gene_type:complete
MKVFKYNLKVYYEDTDFGGIVYHANYLKYFERARSELIYSLGYSNKKLLDKFNILIAVKTCNLDFKKPAKFEDKITVFTKIKSNSLTTITMSQIIKRKSDILCYAEIKLVSLNKLGKPAKLPKVFIKKLIN